jgi:hypothetical protein
VGVHVGGRGGAVRGAQGKRRPNLLAPHHKKNKNSNEKQQQGRAPTFKTVYFKTKK